MKNSELKTEGFTAMLTIDALCSLYTDIKNKQLRLLNKPADLC